MQQGYKQTEVGMIPEDWSCVAAKHLMKIETGSRNTEHKTDMGKYPFFVRSQKVEHIQNKREFVVEENVEKSKLEETPILLSKEEKTIEKPEKQEEEKLIRRLIAESFGEDKARLIRILKRFSKPRL